MAARLVASFVKEQRLVSVSVSHTIEECAGTHRQILKPAIQHPLRPELLRVLAPHSRIAHHHPALDGAGCARWDEVALILWIGRVSVAADEDTWLRVGVEDWDNGAERRGGGEAHGFAHDRWMLQIRIVRVFTNGHEEEILINSPSR